MSKVLRWTGTINYKNGKYPSNTYFQDNSNETVIYQEQ